MRPACLALALMLVAVGIDAAGIKPGNDPLASEPPFLVVDEAFVFSARLEGGRLVGRWEMPDGYYLYRRQFRIDAGDGVQLGDVDVPAGRQIVDDIFGESEVYYGSVEISAAVLKHPGSEVAASFRYQGCADYGLCYPPQTRAVRLAIAKDGASGRIKSNG